MEEGSEPAGTGLSAFCQGKVAAGRGAEGLWQGLVLMAGTHRVLRLGTEPQQHTGEPRGSSAAPGESQGKEHRGQEVAEPPHHLRQAQGTQQVLTAAGAASSGRWEWGRREGRARGERGDTVTAQGELLPLREQKQAGTVQASPAESHQTPRATKHPPHPATPPCFTLEQRPRMGCDFSPGLRFFSRAACETANCLFRPFSEAALTPLSPLPPHHRPAPPPPAIPGVTASLCSIP